MDESIQVGDRVRVHFDAKFREKSGWYEGMVIRIDPYSHHRSFYWVELDDEAYQILGVKQISVFNPKNLAKISGNPNP
jgi:hypothetical protein